MARGERQAPVALDDADRRVVNALQGGFPVCERPFAEAAAALGLAEDDLIARLKRLRAEGVLTRFGPMYQIERMGGAFCLAALAAPEERFDEVAEIVNGFPEVAHNYARTHAWNMWFVIATERPERVAEVVAEIEAATGLRVLAVPKLEEFHVDLRFEA